MTGPGTRGGQPRKGSVDPYAAKRVRVCQTCGTEYTKPTNVPWSRWNRSRWCSTKCKVREPDAHRVTSGPNRNVIVPQGGWTTVHVQLVGDRWSRVRAKVIGPLAVMRALADASLWTILHLPTGAAFGRFADCPGATRAARLLRERDACAAGGPRLWEADTVPKASEVLVSIGARDILEALPSYLSPFPPVHDGVTFMREHDTGES